MGLITKIREYDLFAKPLEDFRIKTSFGGIVTVVSFVVIATLFISETLSYIHIKTKESLYIDYTPGDTNISIYFDLVFHKLPCDFLSVDILDQGGQSQENIVDNVYKTRLDSEGNIKANAEILKHEVNKNNTLLSIVNGTTIKPDNYCGSCYGAIEGCCNTCESVREAYNLRGWNLLDINTIEQCKNDPIVKLLIDRQGEGCRIAGHVQVAKSGGNFHIAPGEGESIRRSHVHSLKAISLDQFDISHTINHISFGENYPGKKFPLNGKVFIDEEESKSVVVDLPYAHKAIVISSCAFLVVACILAGILCIKACLMQKADDDTIRASSRNEQENNNNNNNNENEDDDGDDDAKETDTLRRSTVNTVKIDML
uniref:Endoplasmic reticulum-Golgi intermediate compartment protein 3 n=1 Tax=Parastrongyloides trichosuri TaxID=131310 RepID=A0A0N4ZK95_PARTI